jgi:DNA-binding XRE family transcriptional regulator
MDAEFSNRKGAYNPWRTPQEETILGRNPAIGSRSKTGGWRPNLEPMGNRVYPAWAFQPRLIAYLGYDPFTNPVLGKPKGNETSCIAILSPDAPVTTGQKIKNRRVKLKKTRKQLASEIGVSVKTLRSWETDRRQPTSEAQEQIAKFS